MDSADEQFEEEESSDHEDGGTVIYQGQRRAKIYCMDGHYFHKEKSYPSIGKIYFKCIEYNGLDCRARAESYIPRGDQQVKLTPRPGYEDHDHQPNPSFGPFLEMRKEVIDLCMGQTNSSSLRDIFIAYQKQAKLRNKGAASLLKFDCIVRAVQYRRFKAGHPAKCPKTFEDANDLLTHPDTAYLGRTSDDKEEFYQGIVGGDDDEALVFASKRCLKIARRDMVVASDPTFKLTPRLLGAMQVMILSVLAFGTTLPIAYVVMSNKTIGAYQAAFSKLKGLGLDPSEVITDWEDAERTGWREAFRDRALIVWGCIWHYMRAIHRKAVSLGLGEYWISSGNATKETKQPSLLLRLCCLLPRLPADRMPKGFDAIFGKELPKVKPDGVQFKCLQFLNYLRGEWIDRPDREEVSVHKRHIYVTSGLESVNRSMNREVKDRHPGFNKFLSLIKKKEEETWKEYKNIKYEGTKSSGRTKYQRKSTSHIQRDTDITAATECLESVNDELMFLTLCQPSLRDDFHTLRTFYDDVPIQPLTREQVYDEQEQEEEVDNPSEMDNVEDVALQSGEVTAEPRSLFDEPNGNERTEVLEELSADMLAEIDMEWERGIATAGPSQLDEPKGNGDERTEDTENLSAAVIVEIDMEREMDEDTAGLAQRTRATQVLTADEESRDEQEMAVDTSEENRPAKKQKSQPRRQMERRQEQRKNKTRVKSRGQKAREKLKSKLKRKLKKAKSKTGMSGTGME